MVRKESRVSDSESDVMESGCCIALSASGDESAQKATQNENDFQTTSPMSTSDEESIYKSEIQTCKWKNCSHESKSKIVLLNKRLSEELNEVSDKVIQLENEKSALRKKLHGIEMARSTVDARMKDKLDSLQKLVEERDRQVKELWYVVQMLDDENMMLKSQAEKLEERENWSNKEITVLKASSGNDYRGVHVSHNAADWKEVLDQDLSTVKTQNPKAGRKPSSRKISGRRGRCRQSSVKLPLKQRQRKPINFTTPHAIKATGNQESANVTSSVKLACESKRPVQRTFPKTDSDKARIYVSDWSKEEASQNRRGSKSSTWGSGLWPPEWTTVSREDQQNSWCQVEKVKK